MADLFLGIDGGGSKTRALLADGSGTILGAGVAGSSNHQSVGFASAAEALRQAIAEAFRCAALAPEAVAAACFGLAGVDRPADRALFEAWIAEQKIAGRYVVVNDAELVLAAGTPDGWGLALICGTGSICYGRTAAGRMDRAGGWGHILGDEGSGYDIALQALRLATQTIDGRAEAHAILRAILDHWGLTGADQLLDVVYRPETTRAQLAALAGPVVALAEEGDPYAAAILDRAVRELARLIGAVARKLELLRPPVALGGGLMGASRYLRQRLPLQAGVELGPLTYVDDPARGGLVIARRLLEGPTQLSDRGIP